MSMHTSPGRIRARLAALALAPLVAALLVGPLPAGADDTGGGESTTDTVTEPTTPSAPATQPSAPGAPSSTTSGPTPSTTETPTPTPEPDPEPTPEEIPLPMKLGDKGKHIRELQSRLHQRGLHYEIIRPRFTQETREGVKGFQERRGLRRTGRVNKATWTLLVKATRMPTHDEMHNVYTPGKVLLGPGAKGKKVRDLQARLKQRKLWKGNVTGTYAKKTRLAVRAFQKERTIPVTGKVDRRTRERLHMVTRKPTHSQLYNLKGPRLDKRCETGRALCIDKTSRSLRWVVNGKVKKRMAARFGSAATPTREGQFSVYWKSRDHVSSIYGSPMPFAMFFSGGQAVHYSADFAAVGYDGASHGCVNIRDRKGIEWLFNRVKVGDKVIVYRS
jgi:peptidoglycan hydrolase-like protein with peptidoglycan-binding domain